MPYQMAHDTTPARTDIKKTSMLTKQTSFPFPA